MNKSHAPALSMDVVAKDGTLLRLTVHRTSDGSLDSDSLLEVFEHYWGRLRPMVTYKVQSFLDAAEDRGELTLHSRYPDLKIERGWMTTAADWLQMLDENLKPEGADPLS